MKWTELINRTTNSHKLDLKIMLYFFNRNHNCDGAQRNGIRVHGGIVLPLSLLIITLTRPGLCQSAKR